MCVRVCVDYPRVRDSVPIMQEAAWASGSVWRGAEILAHIRVTTLSPTARTRRTDYVIPTAYLMQYTTNTFRVLLFSVITHTYI